MPTKANPAREGRKSESDLEDASNFDFTGLAMKHSLFEPTTLQIEARKRLHGLAAASCVKKGRRCRKLQFSDRCCRFSTELQRTTANFWQGSQNFNLPLSFSFKMVVFGPKFCILDKNFWQEEELSTAQNLWDNCPHPLSSPLSLRHWWLVYGIEARDDDRNG